MFSCSLLFFTIILLLLFTFILLFTFNFCFTLHFYTFIHFLLLFFTIYYYYLLSIFTIIFTMFYTSNLILIFQAFPSDLWIFICFPTEQVFPWFAPLLCSLSMQSTELRMLSVNKVKNVDNNTPLTNIILIRLQQTYTKL